MKTTLSVWNPVGRWRVTTEGDCEGRSTTELGTHEGHIADIARELADQAYYGLYFVQAGKDAGKAEPKPTPKVSVNIHLDIKSGTWDLDPAERAAYFKQMMKGRPDVSVSKSDYFASVTLNLKRKK